jgi:hypothetical protein
MYNLLKTSSRWEMHILLQIHPMTRYMTSKDTSRSDQKTIVSYNYMVIVVI